ncbi:hypothetical protein AMTRI_Chr09g19840 [Amborella trichopoda]
MYFNIWRLIKILYSIWNPHTNGAKSETLKYDKISILKIPLGILPSNPNKFNICKPIKFSEDLGSCLHPIDTLKTKGNLQYAKVTSSSRGVQMGRNCAHPSKIRIPSAT